MHFSVVLMDGAAVAVALHAALQGGGGETDIVYVAALASVVRTFKMIHYIGFLVMRFPWRSAVPHEKGGCEVGLAESPEHHLLIRCQGRGTPFDDTSDSIAFLFIV